MQHANSIQHLGITQLNAMQQDALEAIHQHNNVMLLSPTGSGKTLGFLLPLLEQLQPATGQIQALVLAPSRELALQIGEVFRQLRTGHKITCCYGGHDIKVEINNLTESPSLLVGTPGRILDHITRGNINPNHISTLVLDEFDKCLDMGFADEMGEILMHLPNIRKRVLTSATPIGELPLFTGIDQITTLNYLETAPVDHKLEIRRVNAWQTDKLDTLLTLICKLGDQSMLIFLNHRDAVERVSRHLTDKGVINEFFHGGLEQRDRESTITRFRNGSCRILI